MTRNISKGEFNIRPINGFNICPHKIEKSDKPIIIVV